jgi:NAD dependent epimerase/dehydratase
MLGPDGRERQGAWHRPSDRHGSGEASDQRIDWSMNYATKKVLVTGAEGFIGSHLLEALVGRGADVTALCLYNSFDHHGWIDELADSTRARMEVVRGDVRDAALVRRIVEGQEVVFHLAAIISIPHSYVAAQSYVDTNLVGTLNVLEAVRNSGVKRLITTSTSEVYGSAISLPINEAHPLQGQSPYSASKIGADMMAEAFARSFGVPVAILRPFNTYGPRQSERAIIASVIRQCLDQACPKVCVGDTSTLRDFMFVADTVAAFLAIGASPAIEFGRAYNAGSGTAVSVLDLLDIIVGLTDCSKSVEREQVRMRPCHSEVRSLLADSSRITAETGWQPTVDLRQGLESTVAWWRDRLAQGKVRATRHFIA